MTARTSFIPLYSEIARESLEKLARIKAQISALENGISKTEKTDETLFPGLMSLENELGKTAFVIIIFSAIAIEAYIYDYAARHLSDKFVQEYIDKLDLIGKLIVVPRLITGQELPRNKKWFGLAKAIVKTRNMIVHSKSSAISLATTDDAQHYLAKIKATEEQILQSAKQAVELLDLLVVELSVIDPDEALWLESYLVGKSQPNLEAK